MQTMNWMLRRWLCWEKMNSLRKNGNICCLTWIGPIFALWVTNHIFTDMSSDAPKYCNLPLPNKPSKHHEYLKAKLHKLSTPAPTDENPNARALSWQKAIEFCSLHHAETTIIPLGIRAGFPVDIDFGNLDRRLETGWIRNELDKIVRQPEESAVFREVKKEVEEVGRMKWSSLAHQSKEERLAAVKPG